MHREMPAELGLHDRLKVDQETDIQGVIDGGHPSRVPCSIGQRDTLAARGALSRGYRGTRGHLEESH